MSEDRFVVVSEWMVHGTITEFVRVNINANRLGLVGFSFEALIETSLISDNAVIAAAGRCRQGVDLHA